MAGDVLARRLREQADWCRRLGSPLYGTLLDEAAADAGARGPTLAVLAGHEHDAHGSALALRFLGAVHRLVLAGDAPALARHYPSAGGDAALPGAWDAFRDVLVAHRDRVRGLVDRPVQTNEPARSAALLGGFLTVAGAHGLPLRLLEIGASAGLNLRWDRYRYESGDWAWGDTTSPVRLTDVFTDARPAAIPAVVATRAGCDRAPVDPTSDEGALTLRAYVWPDQLHRHALLRGAIDVARRVPATVEPADAAAWLAARLAAPATGVATVVYHSITWQYLPADTQRATRATIEDAGRRATASAPVAWLRLEPAGPEGPFVVGLTSWPGGDERALAEASPHGVPVAWRPAPAR